MKQTKKQTLPPPRKSNERTPVELEMQRQVGKRMKCIRLWKGYMQSTMAEMLGAVQSTYSKWENGKQQAPYHVLAEICWKMRITADFLLLEEWKDDARLPLSFRQFLEKAQKHGSEDFLERIDMDLRRGKRKS